MCRQLPAEVQRLVAPYLQSDYQLVGGAQRGTAGIVFGRSQPVAFREWLSTWARQLSQLHCRGVMCCEPRGCHARCSLPLKVQWS